MDLQAKLRRDNGHAARLWMADQRQNELARVASGGRGATGYRHYSWNAHGHGARQFIASLSCQSAGGCPQSDLAKAWVRIDPLWIIGRSLLVRRVHRAPR